MGVIYLVRHGQAVAEAYGSAPRGGLTERGREQARLVGEALAARADIFDVASCGTLPRQQETLEIILESVSARAISASDTHWNEYDIDAIFGGDGCAARTTGRALQRILEVALGDWVRHEGSEDAREAYTDYQRRCADALESIQRLAGSGKAVLAVSSSGTITQIVSQLWDLDGRNWIRLSRTMLNASITKLIVGAGGVSVVSMNEHAHLDFADASGVRSLMTLR
jgi:broad specificity phosphatase PhoE